MAEGAESTKVVTEHPEAAKAIDTLREIARTLKACGDENVQQDKRIEALEEALEEAQQASAHDRARAELLDTWQEAIEDYRRGILDRGELFDRTVGGLLHD